MASMVFGARSILQFFFYILPMARIWIFPLSPIAEKIYISEIVFLRSKGIIIDASDIQHHISTFHGMEMSNVVSCYEWHGRQYVPHIKFATTISQREKLILKANILDSPCA